MYGEIGCNLLYPIQTATIYVLVFTLVVLSCSRYLAIVHPYRPLPTTSHLAKSVLIAIWISSLVLVVPYAASLKLNDETKCVEIWTPFQAKVGFTMILHEMYVLFSLLWISCLLQELKISQFIAYGFLLHYLRTGAHFDNYTPSNIQMFTIVTFGLQYLIPIILIALAYTLIVYDVNHPRNQNLPQHIKQMKQKENTKITRLAISVSIAFAVCLLPHHAIALWLEFGGGSTNENVGDISKVAYFILYLNTALDPILYNLSNSTFKVELKKLCVRLSSVYETPNEIQRTYSEAHGIRLSSLAGKPNVVVATTL